MSNTIYLYLKTHNVTGLKYLGKTVKNPYEYKGSGKHWQRHIKKYGYDVTTEILLETTDSKQLREVGLLYSSMWNIVQSSEFANLIPEGGDGNSPGSKHSEKTKERMAYSRKGKSFSVETKKKLSKAKMGNKNPNYGKKFSADTISKLAAARTGFKFDENAKEKMAIAAKNREQISCPHCSKIGAIPQMMRWHFDNCKHKYIKSEINK